MPFLQPKRLAGRPGGEIRQQLGKAVAVGDGQHGDVQRRFLPDGLQQTSVLGKQRLCLGQHPFSRRGEADLPARPVKQADAQFRFQMPDILGSGGLGNIQPVCAGGKALFLGNGGKSFQTANIHGKPSYSSLEYVTRKRN